MLHKNDGPCGDPQVLSAEQQIQAARHDYDFDHPDAFDFDLLTDTLRKLKQGKSVKIPVYDFTTHGRQKDWVRTDARTCRRSLLIMEYDLLALISKEVFNLFHWRLWSRVANLLLQMVPNKPLL